MARSIRGNVYSEPPNFDPSDHRRRNHRGSPLFVVPFSKRTPPADARCLDPTHPILPPSMPIQGMRVLRR